MDSLQRVALVALVLSALCMVSCMLTMVPLHERSSASRDLSDEWPEAVTSRAIDPVAPESRTSFKFLSAALLFGLVGLLGIAPADRRREDVRGSKAPADPETTEAWLCPGCLLPHVPGADFCPTCSAPLTPFAARGPYEEVFARAWLLGRASQRPARALHVVGLSVVALPPLALFAVTVRDLLTSAPPRGHLFYAAIPVGLVLIALWVRGVARYRSGWTQRLLEVEGPVPYYGGPPWWTFDLEWSLSDDRPA